MSPIIREILFTQYIFVLDPFQPVPIVLSL
ncbi:hypothetical protein Zm00014a_015204 [Zea mays]|uniref:Uncharacterized protein n=1 Tax=Zea mays TaxID=4577 RepID=A0A3L6ERU5_MAIZE|nr:hypothetical protein Zm00014a_015204 [Zea mays]